MLTMQTLTLFRGKPATVEIEVNSSSGGPVRGDYAPHWGRLKVIGGSEDYQKEAPVRIAYALAASGHRLDSSDTQHYTVKLRLLMENPEQFHPKIDDSELGWVGLDLPIAVAVAAEANHVALDGVVGAPRGNLVLRNDVILWGELGLDGRVRAVRGTFLLAQEAKRRMVPIMLCREGKNDTGVGTKVCVVRDLTDALSSLDYTNEWVEEETTKAGPTTAPYMEHMRDTCMSDVLANERAKRAALIAAAGGHPLLLVGVPGAGRTMIARRMLGLLPPMSTAESDEVAEMYSLAGMPYANATQRPFRAPHHSVSLRGVMGFARKVVHPGEVALARHGILYLDELTEFDKHTARCATYAAMMGVGAPNMAPKVGLLIASCHPCVCGYYTGDGSSVGGRTCTCSVQTRARYDERLKEMSKHFQMRVRMDTPERIEQIRRQGYDKSMTTEKMRELVARVQDRQRRYNPNGVLNSELPLLESAGGKVAQLSLNTYKVAMTIVDVDNLDYMTDEAIAEAKSFTGEE